MQLKLCLECAIAVDSVLLDSVQRHMAATFYDTAYPSGSEV